MPPNDREVTTHDGDDVPTVNRTELVRSLYKVTIRSWIDLEVFPHTELTKKSDLEITTCRMSPGPDWIHMTFPMDDVLTENVTYRTVATPHSKLISANDTEKPKCSELAVTCPDAK